MHRAHDPDDHEHEHGDADPGAVRDHLRARSASAWVEALCGDEADAVRDALLDRPGRANQFLTQPRPWGQEMWLPLHYAAENGAIEVGRLLLSEHGVSAMARTRFATPLHARATPLHLAAAQGHAELVALLLKHDAETEVLDARSDRPLHLAARFGHAAVVAALLDANADPEVRNGNGRTALHEAIRSIEKVTDENANAAALLLIERGADPSAECPKEPDARTPLRRCESMGDRRQAVAEALEVRGAQ